MLCNQVVHRVLQRERGEECLPSIGVALETVGCGVLLVAGALAEAKRCEQEHSLVARSVLIIEQIGRTVRRQHLSVGVFHRRGALVSRNDETTLTCVGIVVSWARGLECTGNGLGLSFVVPYWRSAKSEEVRIPRGGELVWGSGKASRMYDDGLWKLH